MALKYIGGGSFIFGVPARDLTDEEEKKHAATIKQQEKASGLKLYEKADEPKAGKGKGD